METSNLQIFPLAKLAYPENIIFGDRVILDDYIFIVAKDTVRLGNYVHIASFTSVTGGGKFHIGDYSTLSSGVRIITGTEDLDTPGLLGSAVPAPYRQPIRSEVRIGKHCMIGANTVILPGADIPDGVVIGAGSLVLAKSKPGPWSIWAGNPLKYFKDRPRDAILAVAEQFEKDLVEGVVWGTEN